MNQLRDKQVLVTGATGFIGNHLVRRLAAEGARVGMLDADIYGPSQPTMLGITGQPKTTEDNFLEPMSNHGLQAMSIGFLIDVETPMVWRGPMVTQALEQLLKDTRWRDLELYVNDTWKIRPNMIFGSAATSVAMPWNRSSKSWRRPRRPQSRHDLPRLQ